MRVAADLDLRENGADNARIISAMDPPHDRRRAPPLPPRTTPFSGRMPFAEWPFVIAENGLDLSRF